MRCVYRRTHTSCADFAVVVVTCTMGKIIKYACAKHGARELVVEAFERAPASIVCGQAGIGGPCAVVCARRIRLDVPTSMARPGWLGDDTWPGRRAA